MNLPVPHRGNSKLQEWKNTINAKTRVHKGTSGTSGVNLSRPDLTEIRVFQRLSNWVAVDFKLHLVAEAGWAILGTELSSVLLASSWRPATLCPQASTSLITTHFQLQLKCLEFSAMSPQNQNCTSEGAVRYIISRKQGLQVSIHSIGNAAGSFACGWWGRKELVALDHWGTWSKHHLVSPFIGALPFDGGKGSKKLSMRWKTRPIRWCYLNFHQETCQEGTLRHILGSPWNAYALCLDDALEIGKGWVQAAVKGA